MDFKFLGKCFAEKPSKKAGVAFIDFPRFAYAHCTERNFDSPQFMHIAQQDIFEKAHIDVSSPHIQHISWPK